MRCKEQRISQFQVDILTTNYLKKKLNNSFSQKIKHLEINLTKEMNELYTLEMLKHLVKEIE